MTKIYAVHGGSSIFTLVKASNEEDALTVFASNQLKDEILVETINEFSVNAGLFSEFYGDEHGSFFDDMTGELPSHVNDMEDVERENYIDMHVEENVREYWEDAPHFANEYLRELKRYQEATDWNAHVPEFSEEFYIDTIKRIITSPNWYDDFEIIEVDLTNTDYQLIFSD